MNDEQPSRLPPEPDRTRPRCPTCGAYDLTLWRPADPRIVPRWILADPKEVPEIDRLRAEVGRLTEGLVRMYAYLPSPPIAAIIESLCEGRKWNEERKTP